MRSQDVTKACQAATAPHHKAFPPSLLRQPLLSLRSQEQLGTEGLGPTGLRSGLQASVASQLRPVGPADAPANAEASSSSHEADSSPPNSPGGGWGKPSLKEVQKEGRASGPQPHSFTLRLEEGSCLGKGQMKRNLSHSWPGGSSQRSFPGCGQTLPGLDLKPPKQHRLSNLLVELHTGPSCCFCFFLRGSQARDGPCPEAFQRVLGNQWVHPIYPKHTSRISGRLYTLPDQTVQRLRVPSVDV